MFFECSARTSSKCIQCRRKKNVDTNNAATQRCASQKTEHVELMKNENEYKLLRTSLFWSFSAISQISNLCAANTGSWSAFFLPPIWNVFTDFACSKAIVSMLNKEKYWKRWKNTQKKKTTEKFQRKKRRMNHTTRCIWVWIFLHKFVHSFKNLISIKTKHLRTNYSRWIFISGGKWLRFLFRK